jgi:predicted DNA binding CopG/RHH family protein
MKKQKPHDPFKSLILDEEEKLIEQELEKGNFSEDPDFINTKSMLEDAASRHIQLNRSKPVTIRINQLDLIKVKAKAKKKNIPYQTLLGSLIHQFAGGEKKLQF